jgi:hypothetical protein
MINHTTLWFWLFLFRVCTATLDLQAQKQSEKLPNLSILINKNKLTPPNTNPTFSNKMTMQQGFICLWESKMERSAHLPLRFRLGCVEAVDRMEGKRRDWLHP